MNRIEVVKLSNYVRPEIKEVNSKDWVMNGESNEMFTTIIDCYYGSPTNSAIIDSYSKMVYGLGLNVDQNFISKSDLKRISKDRVMFGEAIVEVFPDKTMKFVPREKVLPNKAIDNKIQSYWYSFDWNDTKKYEPTQKPAYGFGKGNESQILVIRDYQVGQFYFSNPPYISAIPYAQLEIELSNYYINHVKNGLSFGHVINVVGEPESEEQKAMFDREIKRNLTGSGNAGTFLISYNKTKDDATTIEPVEVSDAHQQYQFLTEEAQNKLCVAHKVVSGAILGLAKATGFSSNAEEIETAFNETYINVIRSMQEDIIDALELVTGLSGIDFIPLRKPMKDEASSQPTALALKKTQVDLIADGLIGLGEHVDDAEWELVDERAIEGEPTITETTLKLAKTFSSFPNVKSEQDNDLFKVRYQYAGEGDGQREFCNKVIKANKVYRKEDIELAGSKVVNAGFGPEGAETYNIWLYKGGVNCKHFWMRKIYLRRNNKSISVNEARQMINDLDPSERASARLEVNDPLVAQPAQASNNYFRLK
jgi:hypothetical protein